MRHAPWMRTGGGISTVSKVCVSKVRLTSRQLTVCSSHENEVCTWSYVQTLLLVAEC